MSCVPWPSAAAGGGSPSHMPSVHCIGLLFKTIATFAVADKQAMSPSISAMSFATSPLWKRAAFRALRVCSCCLRGSSAGIDEFGEVGRAHDLLPPHGIALLVRLAGETIAGNMGWDQRLGA